MELKLLKNEYDQHYSLANRFMVALKDQIGELIKKQNVTLAVPIEYRIKTWNSISDKLRRNSLIITSIRELLDLIGVRLILLFRRDLIIIDKMINDTLLITSKEDKNDLLSDTQFGYQSIHYNIKLPLIWLEIPTFSEFRDIQAEIQIRTMSQHLWAASSHALQYKVESSVPLPIRRSIHRVSALLETVDLEFERVLGQRDEYLSAIENKPEAQSLDVDTLGKLLKEHLPTKHYVDKEEYSELLEDLYYINIKTIDQVITLINRHLPEALNKDKEWVQYYKDEGFYNFKDEDVERIESGIWYTHVGLMREILSLEFGDKWRKPITIPEDIDDVDID